VTVVRACVALVVGSAAWLAAVPAAAAVELPQGPGVDVVYAQCRTCHDLQYVRDAKGLLPAQWKAVIASMRDYGYTPPPGVEAQLLAYLTTYLGPNPPPAAAPAATPAAGVPLAAPDAAALYASNCATCHGAEGRGQPGYFPPLAGNPDVAADRLLPVLVVLNGLAGPIDIAGRHYDGAMPAFGHLADADIAAIVGYVQRAWGNTPPGGGAVDAAAVAAQRQHPMTPADVHAARQRAR
jgi:mono/diheme cytochrome c family protein